MSGSTSSHGQVTYTNTNNTGKRATFAVRVSSLRRKFVLKAERIHTRIPAIKKIPLSALGIISLIAFINMLVWAACGIVLWHRSLISTAAISYSLGLRHALDADHISAIDLMTRRLLASGQKPVTVGTFFSLGHSTIVIITSIVVAATAAAVSNRFGKFSTVGGIIGTSVSAAFLILLGIMNAYILYKLVQQMRKVLRFYRRRRQLRENMDDSEIGEDEMDIWKIEGGGFLFSVLKRMFVLIDRPWKMYPLGILFGLGFDTSSEIALLGISSIEAARQDSFWVILIFPILFTAGMCLLDTTDGALMLSLYIQPATNFLPATKQREAEASETEQTEVTRLSAEDDIENQPTATTTIEGTESNNRDPIAFLYYSIVLTTLTVMVALVIGIIQVLSLILNVTDATGKFWDGVQTASDYYDAIGGGICGCFIIVGLSSVVCYQPWRRWVGVDVIDDGNHEQTEVFQGEIERQEHETGKGFTAKSGGGISAREVQVNPGPSRDLFDN
ncbi:nickel transport protein, putative [Talaromyces stipitatus ATCC 10500]|uniref:Nickel transport protein, putative n=1 Tax=Talaromyces stipitatus (strain ATCC 10500 / CBS 375.48 / QM 6759 / NRRL 1006) TaxID=441959 RepID=B8M2L3_TALSN|nr:nickel transport protein, putative [Talaromyces stipitatus ATCC 10500]EED21924.1 nickel transport protein, putative [Talaromyces stipitatus ATCC 10500]